MHRRDDTTEFKPLTRTMYTANSNLNIPTGIFYPAVLSSSTRRFIGGQTIRQCVYIVLFTCYVRIFKGNTFHLIVNPRDRYTIIAKPKSLMCGRCVTR